MKTIKTSICCALVAIFLCFGLIPAYAVIGGYDAMPGDWPFMVSVQQDGNHRVGGVLITPNWVLTSAAIASHISSGHWRVVVGDYDRNSYDGTEEIINIESFFVHPNWNTMANGFPNDICLLLLSTPSTKTPATLRCSPSFTANCNDDPAVGSTATMIGWGATSGGSPLPGILQQAEITVMSQSDLEQRYIIYGSNTISDSHLGLYNGTVSACIGDSGGPVMGLQQGEKWVLDALPSWGLQNCPPSWPTVCTRISTFRAWIESVTGDCKNSVIYPGLMVADVVNPCAESTSNHGDLINCVNNSVDALIDAGTISPSEGAEIKCCAGQTNSSEFVHH